MDPLAFFRLVWRHLVPGERLTSPKSQKGRVAGGGGGGTEGRYLTPNVDGSVNQSNVSLKRNLTEEAPRVLSVGMD